MNKLSVWQIRVYDGTGADKPGQPRLVGYVRTRKSSQAIIFAQEALSGTKQSFTVEMDVVEPDSAVRLDQAYKVKWLDQP